MQRFVILLSSFAILHAAFSAPAERPNVIVIMADDLGYGDLSCYGATALSTPNMDRLAAEGARFTQGYCSASTCTPTRYSLLTGTYAFRNKGTGIAGPNSPLIIPEDTLTLPDVMKSAGYETAVIGKWHLGLGGAAGPQWNGELKPGPSELGFDDHFILPTTNDRVPQVFVEAAHVLNLDAKDPLWVGDKQPSPDHPTGISQRTTLKMNWSHGHNGTIHNGISRIGFYTGGQAARFRDEDLADKWMEKSREWIEAKREKPFFLFFASHDLHVPRIPHERFQGKSKLGFRGDSILQLDWCVGELMQMLDKTGLTEKTLIILCSDNGPVMDDGYQDQALEKLGEHRAGGPFRGGKYSVYEGGTRTPFITRWKGKIQPCVSEQVVCTIDLSSSLAALTGVALPASACLDSTDVLDALLAKPEAKGREHLIQQDNGTAGNFGYRSGKWKLLRHDSGVAQNLVVEKRLVGSKVPHFQLFDLTADPAEKNDLSAEQPVITQRLKDELEQRIKAGRTRN